jgi:D-3-phosphoglycerate dehydrogenase
MRWRVLVSAPYMQPVIDRFRSIFEEKDIELLVPPVQERFTEEELLQWMPDVDGVISGDDRFTDRVLEAAPRLKVISKWGTGIDSIDLQACRRLGIAVRNTPNAFSEPVADSVMGYLLAFARNLAVQDRHMKQGAWQKIPGRSLRECTLGVIGVGNVGKTVVRRAVAFGMRLLGNDLLEMPEEFVALTGIRMVPKETLLRQADFISLNCDLNSTSHHLINDETLAFVRPTAVLLNTSRGPVVDEDALIKALKEKRLAGAALDVFEVEPLPSESPLRRMDNVLLAPHNANSSPESWERVHESTIKNLLEELGRARS